MIETKMSTADYTNSLKRPSGSGGNGRLGKKNGADVGRSYKNTTFPSA